MTPSLQMTDEARDHGSKRERIVAALSGGVDSSVAAALLVGSGREVIGVTLNLAGGASRCCSLADADDARRVADQLGIRFYVANYAQRFRAEVIEPSRVLVAMGRSPEAARGSLRFSVGHGNDESQIDYALHYLPDLVARARRAVDA